MRMEYTRRLQKEAEDIYKGISMERESFSLDYRPFELPVQEGQNSKGDFFPAAGKNDAEPLGGPSQRLDWNRPAPG